MAPTPDSAPPAGAPLPSPLLPPTSRRAFLAGACASAAPALAARGRCGTDDADDMQAVARLCGLEFSDAERQQAKKRLHGQKDDYAALRRAAYAFELPPCTLFEPVPPGAARPQPGAGMTFVPATDAPLPAADEDLAFAPAWQLAAWLRQGKVTSVRLCELCLSRL